MNRILIGMCLVVTVVLTLQIVNMHVSTAELNRSSQKMGFGG